jgi:TatD-related deoxyribonuclease
MIEGLPVLDAHIHLDPKGEPERAVERFLEMGGTHLLIVHKPYHHLETLDVVGYERSFKVTIEMCRLANGLGARAWCVIGPYPGELPHLAGRMGLEKAEELHIRALSRAFKYVEEGKALGIGEIGRVHFPVNSEVQDSCDRIMGRAFETASDLKCPVILHTESYHSNPDLMMDLAEIIDRSGMKRHRVIKHYSGPDLIDPSNNLGISISLQCRRDSLKTMLGTDNDHLLETDYIDEKERPNVVMPPDTVPKKIKWAYSQGLLDASRHRRLMVELPRKVLGMEME